MKFGIFFVYWEREWGGACLPYIKRVASLGFDVLEVHGAELEKMSDADLELLKKTAEEYNITLTSILGLTPEHDTSSTDESVRKNGVAYMKRAVDAANKCGAKVISGMIHSYWPADYSKPFDKEKARAQSILSMQELGDHASQYGMLVAPEVVNRFEHYIMNDTNEAVLYLKEVDRPNVKALLDCFHMNIEEDFIGDAIRAAGDYLGHYHVGEANRKPPGRGHMPWDEIGQALRDINYQGCVVFEPFVKPGGSIAGDIKVWRDLSGNADDAKMDLDVKEALQFLRGKFCV